MIRCVNISPIVAQAMHAGLPIVSLTVSIKLRMGEDYRLGLGLNSTRILRSGRKSSRAMREMSMLQAFQPTGEIGGGYPTVSGKARNSRPPLVGRGTPVVEGRLSGKPRIERTAR